MADAITPGCIQQLYAAGLRFETELQHVLGPADGSVLSRRLLREDWQSPRVRQHSGWVCASLAKAVLSQSNAIRIVRKDEPDGAAIAGWLAGQLPTHQVELLGRSDFRSWGTRAHEGLTSGGIALVLLQASSHSRWALVVGVEWCSGADPPHGAPARTLAQRCGDLARLGMCAQRASRAGSNGATGAARAGIAAQNPGWRTAVGGPHRPDLDCANGVIPLGRGP